MTKIPEIIMDNNLTQEVDGVYYYYNYWKRKRGGIPFTGIGIYISKEFSDAQKYINGKKHGCYVGYYSCGQLRVKSQYKNGKEEGLFESYHKNGNLSMRAVYKNGVESGPYERFYKNGQRKLQKNYSKDHQLQSEEWFDKNGELIYNQKYFYTNENRTDEEGNPLNGVFEDHYKNGQVKHRINYKDGLRHGLFEHFRENGDVFGKTSFSKGHWVHGFEKHPNQELATIKDSILDASSDDCFQSLHDWVFNYDETPPSIRNDEDIAYWLIDFLDHTNFAEIYVFVTIDEALGGGEND